MNKRLIIIRIIIWAAIAIFLSGVLVRGIAYGGANKNIFNFITFSKASPTVQKDETVSLDGCNEIKIDFSSDDIIVRTTDESKMRVIEKSSKKLKENEKFTIKKENNTIKIEKDTININFNIFNFGSLNREIEIYIPKNYIKDLDIHLSSGDVIFDSDINLNDLKCVQSSGDFNANSINANKVLLKSSSGDIKAENLKIKSYNIKTSSGDIAINSLSGTGEVLASSGDIKIEYKDISEYTKVIAQSGDIKLTMSKDLSFEFHGKCSSGDITSNFELNYENEDKNKANAKVGKGPYKKIDVNTSSGDIKILQ